MTTSTWNNKLCLHNPTSLQGTFFKGIKQEPYPCHGECIFTTKCCKGYTNGISKGVTWGSLGDALEFCWKTSGWMKPQTPASKVREREPLAVTACRDGICTSLKNRTDTVSGPRNPAINWVIYPINVRKEMGNTGVQLKLKPYSKRVFISPSFLK